DPCLRSPWLAAAYCPISLHTREVPGLTLRLRAVPSIPLTSPGNHPPSGSSSSQTLPGETRYLRPAQLRGCAAGALPCAASTVASKASCAVPRSWPAMGRNPASTARFGLVEGARPTGFDL